MTVADVLSMIRVALAFLIAGAATTSFSSGTTAVMLLAFLVAVATDLVGVMLRRESQALHTGVLDSLADKALVFSVLIPIALRGFPPLVALLPLAARDGLVLALQVLAARRQTTLPVGTLGRLKTAILYVACAALLILAWLQSGPVPKVDPGDLGTILPYLLLSQLAIVAGTLLSFITLFRYIATLRSRGAA